MVETACLLVEDALDQILPRFDFEHAAGWISALSAQRERRFFRP